MDADNWIDWASWFHSWLLARKYCSTNKQEVLSRSIKQKLPNFLLCNTFISTWKDFFFKSTQPNEIFRFSCALDAAIKQRNKQQSLHMILHKEVYSNTTHKQPVCWRIITDSFRNIALFWTLNVFLVILRSVSTSWFKQIVSTIIV